MEKQGKHIDRREFLKIVGITTAATTATLYGCDSGRMGSGQNSSPPSPVI